MEPSICYEWLGLQLYSCRAYDLCALPGKLQRLPFSIAVGEHRQNERCRKFNRILKHLHTARAQPRSTIVIVGRIERPSMVLQEHMWTKIIEIAVSTGLGE